MGPRFTAVDSVVVANSLRSSFCYYEDSKYYFKNYIICYSKRDNSTTMCGIQHNI